jgi:hypothetical protein
MEQVFTPRIALASFKLRDAMNILNAIFYFYADDIIFHLPLNVILDCIFCESNDVKLIRA